MVIHHSIQQNLILNFSFGFLFIKYDFAKEFCAAMIISCDAFLEVWTFIKIVLASKMQLLQKFTSTSRSGGHLSTLSKWKEKSGPISNVFFCIPFCAGWVERLGGCNMKCFVFHGRPERLLVS